MLNSNLLHSDMDDYGVFSAGEETGSYECIPPDLQSFLRIDAHWWRCMLLCGILPE